MTNLVLLPVSVRLWRRGWPLARVLAAAALVVLLLGCWWGGRHSARPGSNGPVLAPAHAAQVAYDSSRLRGVSWVAGDSIAAAELAPLLKARVTWIAQMPFGWQAGANEPLIRVRTGRRPGRGGYWGESDAGLLYTAQLAHRHGIRTLLKPHVWVRGNGAWPGDINMASQADWDAWFASYARYMLHYARLAEQGKFDALCIGTELQHATQPAHEKAWRRLIWQIRQVYHGPLTYAANWSGEYQQIRFWDALDYVGIQAYFPLSPAISPSLDSLIAGWQPHLRELAAWQKKNQKAGCLHRSGLQNHTRCRGQALGVARPHRTAHRPR